MRMHLKILLIVVWGVTYLLFADTFVEPKPLHYEVIPYSKTYFEVVDKKTGKSRFVDMKNKDFIVVSVRERGSDGRIYAVDRDGTVWLSSAISSGVPEFRTPSGVFHIYKKDRYYMSKRYPDSSGRNNMDFAMWFTKQGHALHEGDVDWMSHGCVHVDSRNVRTLFRWVPIGMPVIVTRHSYMPFARGDLLRIYGGKKK